MKKFINIPKIRKYTDVIFPVTSNIIQYAKPNHIPVNAPVVFIRFENHAAKYSGSKIIEATPTPVIHNVIMSTKLSAKANPKVPVRITEILVQKINSLSLAPGDKNFFIISFEIITPDDIIKESAVERTDESNPNKIVVEAHLGIL